jgi:NitT/TauT family transport system permease protein
MKASIISNNQSDPEKKSLKNSAIIYTAASFLLFVVIWKIISMLIGAEIIVPSPEKTFIALAGLVKTKFFYIIILSSLYRGIIGFLLSFVLGILFGFLSGTNKIFFKLFEPFLVIIRSTPVITIILIAIIWFKSGYVPVFACFLMVFPIVCTNIIEGIKNIDIRLLQMSKIYKIKKGRIFREIYVPSLSPFIFSAVSTGFGIGWKVVIASEVLSQPRYAIGTSLANSKIYLNIDEVFAWTIVAIILGYVFEKLVRVVESGTLKWKKQQV